MKHLLLAICLFVAPALAETNYIAVVVREDVKHPEKVMGKLAMKEYFEDATEVEWDDLAPFFKLTPTSNDWRIVCYAVEVGEVKKPTKKKGDITEWILQNIPTSERDKFDVVTCGKKPSEDLIAAGYIPMPKKEGTP